eukprot:2395652-Amphidinium_carterae.1
MEQSNLALPEEQAAQMRPSVIPSQYLCMLLDWYRIFPLGTQSVFCPLVWELGTVNHHLYSQLVTSRQLLTSPNC